MNLECSSKGDRRFSAFYAVVKIGNRAEPIERWYQLAKRNSAGEVAGKGKFVAYIINPFTGNRLPAECLTDFYYALWLRYFKQHPHLLAYAQQFDSFTDMFRGHCRNCQADVIKECVTDIEAVKERVRSSAFYADCKNKKNK